MSEAEEVVEEIQQEVVAVEEVVVVEVVKPTRKNRLFYTTNATGEKVIEKY